MYEGVGGTSEVHGGDLNTLSTLPGGLWSDAAAAGRVPHRLAAENTVGAIGCSRGCLLSALQQVTDSRQMLQVSETVGALATAVAMGLLYASMHVVLTIKPQPEWTWLTNFTFLTLISI